MALAFRVAVVFLRSLFLLSRAGCFCVVSGVEFLTETLLLPAAVLKLLAAELKLAAAILMR